jgi:hypothetical protein
MGARTNPDIRAKRAKIVLKRAFELAHSGEFSNWIQIEKAMSDGFSDLHKSLADQFTRDYLNQASGRAQARGGFPRWLSPP